MALGSSAASPFFLLNGRSVNFFTRRKYFSGFDG
jgi:hypothetical protein